MTQPFIEHVNLTVADPERSAKLMEDIFGWKIRWQGRSQLGGRTIHIGSETHYLALYTPDADVAQVTQHKKGRPLNHVGVQVEDLDAVEEKVKAAGLEPFSHDDYEPGRRFYFFDPDGIEFEIVSYA